MREREYRNGQTYAAAHIVEGKPGWRPRSASGERVWRRRVSVCRGWLGGRDQFAQVGKRLEAVGVEGSVARGQGYINRPAGCGRWSCSGRRSGPDIGFHAPSVAHQREISPLTISVGPEDARDAALGVGVGRTKTLVQSSERPAAAGTRRAWFGPPTPAAEIRRPRIPRIAFRKAWLIIA